MCNYVISIAVAELKLTKMDEVYSITVFPKSFFASGPLLASKNNHGFSHPYSRKYGMFGW